MGNRLCCDSRVVASFEQQNNAEQLLRQFYNKNPKIQQMLQKPQFKTMVELKKITKFDNGLYFGKMLGGKRNGPGIMMFEEDMYYEGQWNQDNFQGKGRFIFTNGDFYDGLWSSGLPQGQGIYISAENNWRYEGNWNKGIQDGHGKQSFNDGAYYQGDFKNGKRHGKGKFKLHDGRQYNGHFLNGEVDGTATACDFDYIYQGQWKNGKLNGTGKSQWASKLGQKRQTECTYMGQYKNGQKQGFGEYRDQKNSFVFKGKWQDGYITNKGVIINNVNKSVYEGSSLYPVSVTQTPNKKSATSIM